MSRAAEHDVVIIGGGPAGSTAGAFLARAGRRTLILEKTRFPRFHVGESMLPFGNDVLKASGVWPKVEAAGFIVKRGAEFALGTGAKLNRLWFKDGLDPTHDKTFQVDRATFDDILLRHAASCGCEVREETAASAVTADAAGVTVSLADGGAARARWLIDASGRDTFAGRALQFPREALDIPKRIAAFGHFEGVTRNDGAAAGHITIVRLASGWFWFIPLAGARTSVGMVQPLADFNKAKESVEEWFARTVAGSAELRQRLEHATRVTPLHTTSDYTYRYLEMARERVLLAGDAGGFIDPIFSSGVSLATRSGELAAQFIGRAEAAGRGLTVAEQRAYTAEFRRWIDIYLDMIRMFYEPRSFEVFMQPKNHLRIVQTVNSLLAGNTSRAFGIRWRLKLFYLLCRLQQRLPLAPRIDFAETTDAR